MPDPDTHPLTRWVHMGRETFRRETRYKRSHNLISNRTVITALVINFRYAPGRKEMDKEKGKRKLQENSKRKEQRKITTRWKPIFWTQEPARMADGWPQRIYWCMCQKHLYLGSSTPITMYPMFVCRRTHLLLVVALAFHLHHGHFVLLCRGVQDGRLGNRTLQECYFYVKKQCCRSRSISGSVGSIRFWAPA